MVAMAPGSARNEQLFNNQELCLQWLRDIYRAGGRTGFREGSTRSLRCKSPSLKDFSHGRFSPALCRGLIEAYSRPTLRS